MQIYFYALAGCYIFYFFYLIFMIHGRKMTYIYFSIVEAILFAMLIYILFNNPLDILSWLVYQISLIIFIKVYQMNVEKNKIYEIISDSDFSPIVVGGLKKISNEEYLKIQEILYNILTFENSNETKGYITVSYLKGKLTVLYLFTEYEVCASFMNSNLLDMKHVCEYEKRGHGASVQYVCDVK